MKRMNKSGLMTAVAVSVAALAPQVASAHEKGASAQAAAMERRLEQMEQEMAAMRAELAKSRAEAKSEAKAAAAQVEERQEKVEKQLAESEEHEKEHHSLLFFRGGYAAMEHARNNELLINNSTLNALGATTTVGGKDGDGWYVGAGFDHRLTDDLWGLSDIAAVDGEVMFQYMNFGTSYNALVEAGTGTILTGNATTPGVTIKNQITQFTLTASPKIKFNNLGDFRPWIIPFGLAINVISPPSSGVTVLNPGLMLGAGAEYKIWRDLYAGLDFRYQWTGDDLNYKTKVGNTTVLNKTDIDGFTTGAYLGFGF
ncbi:MAG TPA: hypothetical protein VLU73_15070 [Methylococcaceae bacterium]|nr:hypothetical protein [Methylococcaceae bacterium]